jgi:hypothetical protein
LAGFGSTLRVAAPTPRDPLNCSQRLMQAWPPRSRLCQSFCSRTIQTWHLSEEIWLGEQHMRHKLAILSALAAISLVLITLPGIASAHETRTVAGKYKFVVGFLNEPAIAEQPNGIDLTVTDASTSEPVLGVEKSLKAQIIFGGETEDVTLSPRFNLPGKYTAYVIPTKSGTWKFHFAGKVNSDNVDEVFTSGPGRFNDVESSSSLQFPAKEPALLDLSGQAASAQSAAASAQSSARTGVIVGAVGVVVGLLGLVVGAVALARTRRVTEQMRSGVPERRIA